MTAVEHAGSGVPLRIFVALFPPSAVLEVLQRLRRELEPRIEGLRWTPAPNLHLTLRFFGDLRDEQVDLVADAVREVASITRPFPLTLGSLGLFADARRPRVLWCGFEKGGPVLAALARTLERGFVDRGLGPADKSFQAHLTLGRWRRPAPLSPDVREAIESAGPRAVFAADSVAVVQSILGGGAPRYRTLVDVALTGPDRETR